jgi:hypothetical protein
MKRCFSLLVLLMPAILMLGCSHFAVDTASKGYNPAVPTSFSFTNNYVLLSNAIEDAPIDGQYYDRYNGTWQVDQTDLSFTNNYLSSATNVNVNSTTGSFQVVNFSTANIKPTFVEGATFGKSGFFGTDTEVAMNNGYLRLTNVWLELASGSGSMIYMQGNPIDMGGGTIGNLNMQGEPLNMGEGPITNVTSIELGGTQITNWSQVGMAITNLFAAKTNSYIVNGLTIGSDVGVYSAPTDGFHMDYRDFYGYADGSELFHLFMNVAESKLTFSSPTIEFTNQTEISMSGNLSVLGTITGNGSGLTNLQLPVEFIVAASDETTALTVGDGKVKFKTPFAFTITNTYADVNTAPSGSPLIVGLRNAGTRLATNTVAIGGTGSTNSVFSPWTAIANRSLLSVDVIQPGTGAAGLKVTIQGYRTP